ncbi:MAG: Tol-Pal system beta propeller repeat protein TolB [Pseudomonadota bacterium]
MRAGQPGWTRRTALGAGSVMVAAMATQASAQLTVTIDRGTIRALPIAVSPFASADPEAAALGVQVAEVVAADLDGSGLFRTIPSTAYLQTPEDLQANGPRYADWRTINAEALVMGTASLADTGTLVVEFRLFDVLSGVELRGLRFTAPTADWRRIAHKVADDVYARITGETGYFDTRIVYVGQTGPATQRVKRLAIMDQDGANNRFLTSGANLVLTPRFAPDGQTIAFLSYAATQPQVRLIQADGTNERVVGSFPGMTFSPRFSPDGRQLAMTIASDGNADLILVDLASRGQRRLTNGPGIDTSPSFSPDGRRLVFNSDRGGSPQLYVMDLASGRTDRISFGQGRYGSPAWSPRGGLIAYVNQRGADFHVGVMRPDGGDERLLTRSYLDEGPRFAPNGRVIVFERADPSRGRSRLNTIDVTGYNIRELPTPVDASDPDWSPLRR